MIDWTRVAELRAEIGEDDFAEVAALFLDEVEEGLSGLAPGSDTLAAGLHALKGSALNLGFDRLAALCGAGEAAAEAGAGASVDLAEIASCFAASRAAFAAGCSNSGNS
jgi:HPt (histidine-containing phosphotransfer) domain-containing protein